MSTSLRIVRNHISEEKTNIDRDGVREKRRQVAN